MVADLANADAYNPCSNNSANLAVKIRNQE